MLGISMIHRFALASGVLAAGSDGSACVTFMVQVAGGMRMSAGEKGGSIAISKLQDLHVQLKVTSLILHTMCKRLDH